MHAPRRRLYVAQRVVNAQLGSTQRLPRLLHRLAVDGLVGMVEHGVEEDYQQHGNKSHHPQTHLDGQRMANLITCSSYHTTVK